MILKIFLAIILFVLIISVIIAWKMCSILIDPNCSEIEQSFKEESEKGKISLKDYDELVKENFTLKGHDDYQLSCQWIYSNKNKVKSEKVVILSHGYSYNRVGSIKYIDIFLNNGYDVIIYDFRNCGYNEKCYTTMGYLEKIDLKKIVDYVIHELGDKCVIGMHGESMGAATVLQHASIDERVSFVIADSPYDDLKRLLKNRLKIEYKLPSFPILNIASLFCKIRAGFFFNEVSPIRDIEEKDGLSNIPIFFIHGEEDDYISFNASKHMYNIKKGSKKLYITPNANHSQSISVNKEKYIEEINSFLQSINKL